MARVFSGIQPSGDLHLGNHLGALTHWVKMQDEHETIYCIVDLHALTLRPDAKQMQTETIRLAQLLLSVGLDPDRCTLFTQSHVVEHTELSWMLECTASFGELSRMTQFKEKSARTEFVSAGLFTYPVLQAADILLYDTDLVPVGDDQRQHVELTRDIAERFNRRYGETLQLPDHVIAPTAARIMDLQSPNNKMSKSVGDAPGTVWMLDDPSTIEKKFKRAVTDSDNEVRFDFETKPGVSNLLSILGAVTDRDPETLAEEFDQYGPLKAATAEAVIAMLSPIQARFAELENDPAETRRLLAVGADKAREVAVPVIERVRNALGLLSQVP